MDFLKSVLLSIVLLAQSAPSTAVRTGSVSGQVLSSEDSPLADFRVAAIELTDAPDANPASPAALMTVTQTNAGGNYTLRDVPAGRYLIAVGRLDALAYFPGTWSRADAKPVTVETAAQVTSINLRVTFGSIAGRASVPKGAPVAGVELFTVLAQNTSIAPLQNRQRGQQGPQAGQSLRTSPRIVTTTTDRAGMFTVKLLPPGSYFIGAAMIGEPQDSVFYTENLAAPSSSVRPTAVAVTAGRAASIQFVIPNDTAEDWEVKSILQNRIPFLGK